MAAIAASIAETVTGMQRVLAKERYSSDSDEPYLQPSNRGKKLKRRSHHISGGLDRRFSGSQRKKTIKHAGYTRDILRRNPKRYDDDGDELATEDEDEAADARAAEENPYSDIRLEELLAPLTSAANLPDHPSLSATYTSTTLSDMAHHSCEVVQRERKTLAGAKKMLTRLRGDDVWVPAGNLREHCDHEIFDTAKLYDRIIANAPVKESGGKLQSNGNGLRQVAEVNSGSRSSTRTGVASCRQNDIVDQYAALTQAEKGVKDVPIKPENMENGRVRLGSADRDQRHVMLENQDGDGSRINNPRAQSGTSPMEFDANSVLPSVENGHLDDRRNVGEVNAPEQGVQEGMRSPRRRITRAQAQADKVTATSGSESPTEWIAAAIHPLFLIPSSAEPDPDFGLPPLEAQETRHLLAMYVQKQEEVCRGAERLYEGLLLADRQRKEVLKWCKAEAHVGEMSDGEDWYDKEEWGLEEDLRKGHAEEEEDPAAQGKKTRGRRA